LPTSQKKEELFKLYIFCDRLLSALPFTHCDISNRLANSLLIRFGDWFDWIASIPLKIKVELNREKMNSSITAAL